MKIATRFSATSTRLILAAGLVASGILAMAPSTFAQATTHTYAYVNTSGDVTTVTATDPQTALTTAPNIALHSGVLLLNTQLDASIVGNSVSGV